MKAAAYFYFIFFGIRETLIGIDNSDLGLLIFQKNYRDMKQKETEVKRKLKERRQNAARARKYYADFHIQHRARMSKKRSKEERVSALQK